MTPKKILGWLLLIVATPFWFYAIYSASAGGFFENEFAVQTMVLGGAVSMIAGLFLWWEY